MRPSCFIMSPDPSTFISFATWHDKSWEIFQIRDVRLSDAGDYICHVTSEPSIDLKNHLTVLPRPTTTTSTTTTAATTTTTATTMTTTTTGEPRGNNSDKWNYPWLSEKARNAMAVTEKGPMNIHSSTASSIKRKTYLNIVTPVFRRYAAPLD